MQTLTPRLGFFRNQTQIHKSFTEDVKNEQLTNTDARARTHNPKKETVSQDYYLARGPRFETQQIEKIELDQIPFSSHTRPSTLRLLLAFHTVDQQPLFFPHARQNKEENTQKKISKSTSETREPKPQLNQKSTQRQHKKKKILSTKVK
jgi:hypothetical protein